MSNDPVSWAPCVDARHQIAAMLRTAFILAIVPVLATCAAFAESSRELTVPGFSCGAGTYAIRLPQSLRDLRRMAKLEAQTSPRKDVGWEDYRVLRFPDLEIGISISNRKDKYVLQYAQITGPQWRVAEPLRVGASATAVLEVHGLKGPLDGVWKLWAPGPDEVLITVSQGWLDHPDFNDGYSPANSSCPWTLREAVTVANKEKTQKGRYRDDR